MRATLALLLLYGSTSICAMLQSASSSSVLPPTSRKRTRDAGSSLLVSAVRAVGSSLSTGVLPSLDEESTSDSEEERDTESGCSSDEEDSNSIILAAGACALGAIYTLYLPKLKIPHFRRPNVHRDRSHALEFVRSWDDVMFFRQFRLKRIDFYNLLRLILKQLEGDEEMARRSSGSSVNPELRLCMTCRILAGAQYLDMIWYQVHVDHVWDYISPVLEAIHSTVDNVRLPVSEADINAHAAEWGRVQTRKLGCRPTPDLLGAADGLVIQRKKPTKKELEGRDPAMYMNRKGYYAWVALAIVGAFCQFLMFEIKWPGATNDCTAFMQSKAVQWMAHLNNLKRGWVAGDDAFSGLEERLLTPFTKCQLKKGKEGGLTEYLKMRAFNHILSSQRITVERAFGLLVRRFGCLWSAFEKGEENALLMVIVCVKLHNICIERWRIENPTKTNPTDLEVPDHFELPDGLAVLDKEVADRLENKYPGAPKRAKQNQIRLGFCNSIYGNGIRFENDENEYAYS